jgi:predicted Fe-Mo cluster-binding NifX family protein
MKIAVASPDGISISKHFGRSTCFIVFEVKDGKIAGSEIRTNYHTTHAKGECNGHDHEQNHHNHDGIIAALKDCSAVLCYGMGWRAGEDLKQSNIKVCILESECLPEDAVKAYIAGNLKSGEGFCRCHQ